jgi:hypothetical protein
MLLVLIFLILVSIPLAMQIETGAIEGVITDDRGSVAGASVEARNVMTGVFSLAESNAAGQYKLTGLRAGRYSLWVQAAHHNSTWIPKVIVERGQTTQHDIRLSRAERTMTGLTRDITPQALR